MKKKILAVLLIVIISIVTIFWKSIYLYTKHFTSNSKYFGAQYNEILHIASVSDKKKATEVMNKIDGAFSFVGDKAEAEISYGALSRYCVTDKNAAKENHDIELITASFDTDSGCLWFVYDREILDANNQTISGSRDVLVRVALAKTDHVWKIVEVKEKP